MIEVELNLQSVCDRLGLVTLSIVDVAMSRRGYVAMSVLVRTVYKSHAADNTEYCDEISRS